jgi:Domain of unknown function (DUF4388)
MQDSRFVVLSGHLSDYPLSDLVGILRHQRKTGRLRIEYPKSPGTFFFHNGELVDAHIQDLTGLQAICMALAQPEAAFNFNPLIPPSRRTIAPSLQRAASELLGCWDESPLQIEGTRTATNSQGSLPTIQPTSNTPQPISPGSPRALPSPPASPMGIQRSSLLFVAAAAILIMGLATVIALSGRLNSIRAVSEGRPFETTFGAAPKFTETENHIGTKEASKATRKSEQLARQGNRVSTVRSESNQSDSTRKLSSQTASAPSNEQAKPAADSVASPQSITVIMQIENGRVLKASIANHKPGMDSYEGLALRVAKQRRYSSQVTGQESVKISVSRPD